MSEPRQVPANLQEEWFLRLFLRRHRETSALEDAPSPASLEGIDWPRLYRLSLEEGLAPLLYHVVRDRRWAPPEVEEDLRRAYRDTVLRNTCLFQQLEDMLHALAAGSVEVILLKGASLCKTVYGRAGVRSMGDLDLLVRKQDVPATIRVLGELGCVPLSVETRAGAGLAFENEVALSKPGLIETVVEVHWSLFNSPHYQQESLVDWLWQTATPAVVGDASTWVMAPEAQLLHLCGHLALHHHGHGLLWHHDVAETIALDPERIDWEEVLDRARLHDLVLPLQTILPRVAHSWGAPVPPGILGRLAEMRPSPGEARVFSQLTAERRPVAQRFWADLTSMRGWRKRLHYAWINLLPSPAYMRQRYGFRQPLLLPLYYVYRCALGIRSLLRWAR